MAKTETLIKPKRKKMDGVDWVCLVFLSIFSLLILIPFIYVIMVSFMNQKDYLNGTFLNVFTSPTFQSYQRLFEDGRLWTGYKSTLIILGVGMPLNIFLTYCLAYGLSRNGYPGKKLIFALVLVTMIFQGGIVPLYLLMKSMNLTNSYWSVILAYGVNTFYMILVKNYIDSLPDSVVESAHLDGAGEWTILFKIVLPLSKPILATVVLFYSVDRWNEWYNSMIFMRKSEMFPLQLVLRNIVINSEMAGNITSSSAATTGSQFTMGIKMAAVMMTMLPIMCVYPFLQKYFVKGIMVGAVKG